MLPFLRKGHAPCMKYFTLLSCPCRLYFQGSGAQGEASLTQRVLRARVGCRCFFGPFLPLWGLLLFLILLYWIIRSDFSPFLLSSPLAMYKSTKIQYTSSLSGLLLNVLLNSSVDTYQVFVYFFEKDPPCVPFYIWKSRLLHITSSSAQLITVLYTPTNFFRQFCLQY